MSANAKKDALRVLAERIHSQKDWWLFPDQGSIQGFMGTDPVFIVGDQPSKSEWPPEHPNRRAFYGLLQKIGAPNVHLTDLYKKRGECGALRTGLPDDFEEHVNLFRREIEILQPIRIVALGHLAHQLLMQHVPECKPMLRLIWHFSYAVRYGKLSQYEADMRRAIEKPADVGMSHPAVTRIRVEYNDGSCDTIELLQRGDFPLYGLIRKRPDSEQPRSAYTTAAIAALLFSTAFATRWTDYSATDKKLRGLIRHWVGESPPQKQEPEERSDTQ